MEGALRVIRFAREHGRPFLGTCGGCQHAVLEFARNVLKISGAGHAEVDPSTPEPVITNLVNSINLMQTSSRHQVQQLAGFDEGAGEISYHRFRS